MFYQLIFVNDQYEIADENNSEIPEWPVQSADGRWQYPEFEGQRVSYDRQKVEFSFLFDEGYVARCQEMLKELTMNQFRHDNTDGYTDSDLELLNVEFAAALASENLEQGSDEWHQKTKSIAEKILNNYTGT